MIIDKIRNILEKLKKFWIFNVNFNEFIRNFYVSLIFDELYRVVLY